MKPTETVLECDTVRFLGELNATETSEAAYQCLVGYAEQCGFPVVLYEYCADITATKKSIFMRSNLPQAFERLEKVFSTNEAHIPGRVHSRDFLTPAFAGLEFVDMYPEFPLYGAKMQFAYLLTGLRSGFGIPLRTQNAKARAGIGFGSKLKREACREQARLHGAGLTIAAWNTHMRILQLQTEYAQETPFTPNQLNYLKLLCEGLMDKQISHQMGISHSGVRKYQNAVARKLGVKKRSQIISETIQNGYLEGAEPVGQLKTGDMWDMEIEHPV